MSMATILGTAVSLLMGFRINAAYDRWWEARKEWGSIVNSCRTFTRRMMAYSGTADKEIKDLSLYLSLWTYTLNNRLRCRPIEEGLESRGLPKLEEGWKQGHHAPNLILQHIAKGLHDGHKKGLWDTRQLISLEEILEELTSSMGRCERIKNTVFPAHYQVYATIGITIFSIMLPFGMLASTGAFSIVISSLVYYFFSIVDSLAREMQDPFENTGTDVPMTAICVGIQRDLMDMNGLGPLPAMPQPDKNGVLM
jgi:putative membrane protein